MNIPRTLVVPFFLLPWLAAVGLVGWILLQRFPPNGVFVATTSVDGKSPFINPFLPSQRVTVPGSQQDGWIGQRVLGDPVYFTARVPGPYSKVNVEIEFRPLRQPLLEFGIVRDSEGKDLELRPLYFSGLDADGWELVDGGYVRKNTRGDRLAIWHSSSVMPLLKDRSFPLTETAVSLRGGHDFYFVPSGESLDVTFLLQDANRKRGTTVAAFRVFRDEEEIKREAITTNASRETTMGKVTEHRIAFANLTPGVYRVVFQADDDVFIRAVRTTSRRWVVGPRLNVGDVVGYSTSTFPARAWTNSRHIVAETFHREGLQTMTLGSAETKVIRTHEPFRLDRTDSEQRPVRLFAPQGDIRVIGDGWFALREDAFFEPKPKRLTDGTDLNQEQINRVQTPYVKPTRLEDGWMATSFSYPLEETHDRLRFVLSAPGVASRVGAVDVRKITMTYHRAPLTWAAWWNLLLQEAKNAWRRL